MSHRQLMESEAVRDTQRKQAEKLSRIARRIEKERRNTELAEKQAAEFKEIRRLLESNDDDLEDVIEKKKLPLPEEPQLSDCSVIPHNCPGVKVFHKELTFKLFQESDCLFKNFAKEKQDYAYLSTTRSLPSEEFIRKLITHRLTETFFPEEGKHSPLGLYVLYLMSVHQEPNFVTNCYDFLKHHKFSLRVEDLLIIFSNLGAKWESLFDFCEETFREKFPRDSRSDRNAEGASPKPRFPFLNLEMVARILLQCVGDDLLLIHPNVKSLVRALVKITLDPEIRSGVLLPLFSTILAALCSKTQKDFGPEEVLGWVHSREEHLLNQLEISQSLHKPICPDLHDRLLLKILSEILQSNLSPPGPPFEIDHVRTALKKSIDGKLLPLELYTLLQVINGSLPAITATAKHCSEINCLLACLEQKIATVEDSIDVMRLKLEVAKVGNLVTNNVSNRFAVQEKAKGRSAKKAKCSN